MFRPNRNRLSSYLPLTNQDILDAAPSVGAVSPHAEVSDRYQMIPTIAIVDMMRKEGWQPMQVSEVRAKEEGRRGFQKHLIRFQHNDLILGDEAIDAVLVNSHDRSCAYQFFTGVYRFICSNGMIVGDTFERISIRHMNFQPEEVIEASYKILDDAPAIGEKIKEMKSIALTDAEKAAYAGAALQLVYDETDQAPYRAEKLLSPKRSYDRDPDLWKTFNSVQENIMKGGIRGLNPKTRKPVTTRQITSIDKNVKLNRALWTLTEKMMELKRG